MEESLILRSPPTSANAGFSIVADFIREHNDLHRRLETAPFQTEYNLTPEARASLLVFQFLGIHMLSLQKPDIFCSFRCSVMN
jgi:hypothetical protein